MNNPVLIFGKNSFVASGIEKVLVDGGYEVDFFTRGEAGRANNLVYGNTDQILQNAFFRQEYDSIINYVVLKDAGVTENIQFIQSLLDFCVKNKVHRLIHFSSIMVYDYSEKYVDESTPIESSATTLKKGYGKIKIAVDEYLLSVKDKYTFEIILLRPGYVLDKGRSCPFVKQFPLGINLVKGSKKSKQPIVLKESVHEAVLRILSQNENLPVYHFFPDNDQTKYQFTKENFNGIVLLMPEFIFRNIPFLLTKFGLLPKSLYSRFDGMYIKSVYSSKLSEDKLQMQF